MKLGISAIFFNNCNNWNTFMKNPQNIKITVLAYGFFQFIDLVI